ncbi:gfo/Idh/MocA family oxidoreductase [Mycolicibacterium sp. P1-18]|uniref:Gfo/Idh/MocA family protein n=1 Tax=Mycolicibacterium sp. P1-18 TaxID=2024615 RepID=UPI0011F14207|nr:Gfo/Idh/MocA family oxidoreductase [Mycolicibacterium sp. P1-18]KAA0098594.1 gfo/Idh/MocA family oxidoreductase [Mycolicibacterium sp. P1-18]
MNAYPHLTWGLIGASDIAETRMIPALRRVGHTIAGVASGNPPRATAFAKRNEIDAARHGFSLDRLLSDRTIDAVYISSVNDAHLTHASRAAAAGKHVLCEKPLSTDLRGAQAILDACIQHRVVLGVNHHLPAAGTHSIVRHLVSEGAVGRVLAVNVQHTSLLPERLRGWRLQGGPGAGAVMDLSCHDASVVNPLLQTRALHATAVAVRQGNWNDGGAEDAVSSVLLYEDDVLVRMHDSFTTPFAPTRLEVFGEAGSIVAEGVMTPEPEGTIVLRDARGERTIEVTDRRHTYDITLERFSHATYGEGSPIVDGYAALKALSVSVAILGSAHTGTTVPVDLTVDRPAISG